MVMIQSLGIISFDGLLLFSSPPARVQSATSVASGLRKIRKAKYTKTFVTNRGDTFVLLGMNYYRPGAARGRLNCRQL